MGRKSRAAPPSPIRCFNSSPEAIHLIVMMYVKYPMSLRNVEDLLAESGMDICHETVRFWWNLATIRPTAPSSFLSALQREKNWSSYSAAIAPLLAPVYTSAGLLRSRTGNSSFSRQ